jgi:predicted protein tyrosine phosphatase
VARKNSRFEGLFMGRIHVCSLARVPETVRSTGARSLITLIDSGTAVSRPTEISADRHLLVAVSDIVKQMDGHILPSDVHVGELLDFVRQWDRADPILIHCFAGVSRSTAAAFIAACALSPHRDENDFAQAIRRHSPTATPNARLVAVADAILQRRGRMSAAVEKIGRGDDCFEGVPFALELR